MTADVSRETPPPLVDLLAIRVGWRGRFPGRTHPSLTELIVEPETGYPAGRKGLQFARFWEHFATPETPGMVINDADCVIDAYDHMGMVYAAQLERDAVHTAPVRLYPRATNLPDWVWGHRKLLPRGLEDPRAISEWQTDIDDPDMFTFNFTYLPRRLVEAAIKKGLETWMYPKVDWRMWETAKEIGVPVRVVRNGCHPTHINY